jgi:hypothetical protein
MDNTWQKILILIVVLLLISYFFGFIGSKEKFGIEVDMAKCNSTETIRNNRSVGNPGSLQTATKKCDSFGGSGQLKVTGNSLRTKQKYHCNDVKKYQMIDGVCKEINIDEIV